ncbi:MAG: peptidoglycan-binding protein [Pseudomonadota bacterium]
MNSGFAGWLLALTFSYFVMPDSARAEWVDKGYGNDTRRSFTDKFEMTSEDYVDPEEKMRTWNSAAVWVPIGLNRSRLISMEELLETYADSDEKFPTAIFMHGCAGLWSGSHLRMKFLADNGFLTIGPASFARKKYAKSCNDYQYKGGLFRDSHSIRKIDAGHAIEQAKELPFVDGDNMLLIGLSEGGMASAIFRPTKAAHSLRARVIEGWTCHSGWYDQAGLNAPDGEPVLSLLGKDDPWINTQDRKGDCGPLMNKENGSKSVVYKTGQLARRHELLEFREVQEEVLAFLRQHFDLPLSVRDIQKLLTAMGYDPGPIDGAWGAKTLAALNALRADNSLPAVSEMDGDSQSLLQALKKDL